MAKSRTAPPRPRTPPRKKAENADANPRLQRAAQLGYIASVAASQEGCNCGAATALREQNQIMLGEYKTRGAPSGAGPDPLP